MNDCIFCKIIAGTIPHYPVYADDHTLAFLDIHPHAKGHTVLIPRAHREHIGEMSEEESAHIARAVKATVAVMDGVLRPEGYNIGWNDRPAAGQVVPHLHIHILPRWQGDGGGSMHSIVKNPGEESVADVARLFA